MEEWRAAFVDVLSELLFCGHFSSFHFYFVHITLGILLKHFACLLNSDALGFTVDPGSHF